MSKLILPRRAFIKGGVSLLAAPAIIRSDQALAQVGGLMFPAPGPGYAPAFATFDPVNIAPTNTLSNGNLTVTATGTPTDGGIARTLTSHSSGKYYAEFTPDNGPARGCGICNTSQVLTNYLGETTNGTGGFGSNSIFYNNSNVGTIGTYLLGNTLCMAVDLTNGAVWWRFNGGNWNNDVIANQNPATNTGGIRSAQLPTGSVFMAVDLEVTAASIVANFGATAFSFTSPSGFGNW